MSRCTTFVNSFGQRSLIVPAECPVDEIPAPFRSLIPDKYFACLECSRPVLLALADRCGNAVIARWLAALAESPAGLIVHHATMMRRPQVHVAICASLPRFAHPIQFTLPSSHVAVTGNAAIDSLYKAVGRTFDGMDAFERSGWESSDHHHFDWRHSFADFPSQHLNSLLLYQTNTGDKLLASGGDIYSFMHDSGQVNRQGTAQSIVEDYFLSQLEGRLWYPFPY